LKRELFYHHLPSLTEVTVTYFAVGKSVVLSLPLHLRIPFLRGMTLRGWAKGSWRFSETSETIPHSHLCEKLKTFHS